MKTWTTRDGGEGDMRSCHVDKCVLHVGDIAGVPGNVDVVPSPRPRPHTIAVAVAPSRVEAPAVVSVVSNENEKRAIPVEADIHDARVAVEHVLRAIAWSEQGK